MNLADRAYEMIRRDILSCELQPGQQIAQAQLAKTYGVGMTPVREALQRLSHEGFVSALPRSGYTVSHITFSDVRELFELRTILETSSVRLAAMNATSADLDRIARQADFTYAYSNLEDYTRFLAANRSFHCMIAASGGNKRLTEALSRTLDSLNRVFHLGLDLRDSAEEMRTEHLALAQALSERCADEAVVIVNQQINRSVQRVVEALTHTVGSGMIFDPGPGIQSMVLGEKKI